MGEPVDKQVTAAKRVAEAESIIKKELSNLSDNVSPNYRILLAVTHIFLIAAKFAILKRIRETMSESEHNRLDEAEQMVQDILGQNNWKLLGN